MIIDTQRAFEDGNQGVTIYYRDGRFMVSVKREGGAFSVGYGTTPQQGLEDALKVVRPVDDFDDLLG